MNKPEIKKGTIKRIMKYITSEYKKELIIVFVCIILSSIASVAGSLFLQTLIDNYITPLLEAENPVFTGLIKTIGVMAVIYIVGIITGYLYSRIMAVIAQGVLRNIRNEMFEKMERLPIKYFDIHTHGDIMSTYTNDVDTLEQMISQGLPQAISSVISVIAIFCAMIYLSPILTVLVIIFTGITILTTKRIASKSSKYFISQQHSLGKVNGYIEEMLKGQKVVKVFTHEEKSKEEFNKLNDMLNDEMYEANKFANILMPIANNLGNLQYVLIAIVGTYLTLTGKVVLSIGTIVSFLQLTRNFSQPINQVMNQLNFVLLALAGASRVFEMMDEEPEKDDGYVTLVNIKKEDGKLVETSERTGMWAWKHPHHDGTVEYVELKGHIELKGVDFSYVEGKQILHDISMYAKPGQKIALVGQQAQEKQL